ncbi:hypothetical protein [Glaciihabitans sp. INWT7]|uniref:hypothetical protein n=1 Tax=Glaciihabitans sp. INWT7 TaxID=2596912 RepID=UPI002105366A|nr:hypothetical protein [Glaciihabitans sp. INWT7]
MARAELTERQRSTPPTLRVRYRLTPWWVKVVVVWAASRLVSTSLLLYFAARQAPNPWSGANPGYLQFAQFWDSTWYHIVAVGGYPATLPLTASGHVAENAWAFLPAYPMLVRFVMAVTTLPWEPVSVAVSFVFSLLTALMIYRLFLLRLPAATALFAVVLWCVAPLSPVLQVSYAESMHSFFLALALYLLIERRYGLLFPAVAIMSLTRPSGLAFALALALHFGHRWITRVRDPFPARERMLAAGLAGFSLVMGLAWPIVAWAVTGSLSAYTDTELAWRSAYIGYVELQPFAPWLQATRFWGDLWHLGAVPLVALALLVVGFAAALFLPAVRRLGPDLRFWSASYGLYLLAVFFPQSSTFRLLVPMFPLLGAIAQPRSAAYRVVLVVACIVGQFAWLSLCWWFDGYDWTPP